MKKLPDIYKQDINKKITNNDTVYYSTTKNSKSQPAIQNIETFLDNLFKEEGHLFNKPLLITTKDKTYDTAIVKSQNGNLYTLSDDIIKISDITKIERK